MRLKRASASDGREGTEDRGWAGQPATEEGWGEVAGLRRIVGRFSCSRTVYRQRSASARCEERSTRLGELNGLAVTRTGYYENIKKL